MNSFCDVKTHGHRSSSRNQWDPVIIGQFLANRFAVAHEQSKNRRIGPGFTTNALANFCDGNCRERRFFRRFPNRDWEIKSADHCDDAERMPLLHQPVTRSFRLNCQPIKHARLADREVADIYHLLNFAFPFSDDLTSLERDQLAELVFQFAQCVTQATNGLTAHRTRSRTPFQKRFLSTRNRLVIIVIRCGAYAGDSASINWRNLVDLCTATAPFAIKDAVVYVSKTKLF